MKKNALRNLFIVLVILITNNFLFAQNSTPEFEGENVIIIDTAKVKGTFRESGGIILKNKTIDDFFIGSFFAYTNNNWIKLAELKFNYFDEIYIQKSTKTLRLKNIRYFAIQREDYGLLYSASINDGDLYIDLRSENSDITKTALPVFDANPNAYVFSKEDLEGRLNDNIEFTAFFPIERGEEHLFKVSVYDPKTGKWIMYGTANLWKTGKETEVDEKGRHSGLKAYTYYAVESFEDTEYEYMVYADGGDLWINVNIKK